MYTGSVARGFTRRPMMTAHRRWTLACGGAPRVGPGQPRDLRTLAPTAGAIPLRNVYGWFERSERDVYRLTRSGEASLD